ncbi:hypothetical protein GCM10010840_15800 [Deinococcus aerolatus]|uniref:Cysteine desulfurase n=1 Tax=Deinococcus aerolatus TaxID=522487 RepID=A0ABQ2G7F6_9DEIO|nr:hypothetical protein [Deinococcus aerolatus]GGL78796.1 hypothetical protein GCM10010840_15800 [Deinococcus aerolatus]
MTTVSVSTATVSPLGPHLGFIRSQFPALDSPRAFLDNAGGSPVLRGVAERVSAYLLSTSVQPGATDAVSQEASARVAADLGAGMARLS